MIKNSLYIARLFMLKSNPKKKCYSKISEYILANIESIDRITIDTLAENTDTIKSKLKKAQENWLQYPAVITQWTETTVSKELSLHTTRLL